MSQFGHNEPATRGAWSVEPVHDAVVTARMHDLRNGHADAFDRHEAVAHAEAAGGAPGTATPSERSGRAVPGGGRVRALRVRVGRALVAFGSYVEGPCDCPEGAAGVGAA